MKYGYKTTETPIDVGPEHVLVLKDDVVQVGDQGLDEFWINLDHFAGWGVVNVLAKCPHILAIRRRKQPVEPAHKPRLCGNCGRKIAPPESETRELLEENKALKDQLAKAHRDSIEPTPFAQAVAEELARARAAKSPKFTSEGFAFAVICQCVADVSLAMCLHPEALVNEQETHRQLIKLAAMCQRVYEDLPLGEGKQ